MAVLYYFAWTDEATAFGLAMHVEDEQIFALDISQAEGDFASAIVDVVNPRIGLLGPGRQQWCWIAWKNGAAAVEALFHGRLVGVPQNLTDEVVRLQFIARPSDYADLKEALAESLRVLPYWDPVFVQAKLDDPDTVLETRPALFNVDRVTLDVTLTSKIEGEDTTIDIDATEHFYDGVTVSYAGQPLRRIKVSATVEWTQVATGELDLTRELVIAFQDAGSPFAQPIVGSYTAPGLLDDWPKPLADLGGGWSMAALSDAAPATWIQAEGYGVRYTDKTDNDFLEGFEETIPWGAGTGGRVSRKFFVGWKNYDVTFALAPISVDFLLAYEASRKRSEVLSFTVEADIQSILTDPGGTEEAEISLSSTFIDQPIDAAGALPIVDLRRNAYFPTDRGQQSLQFLALLARATLLTKARAVLISFQSPWGTLAGALSCRKSITLHDARLPDGVATGKITLYRLIAAGDGDAHVEVTIGCSIGYGVALPAAAAGDDVYADGYSVGYTQREGEEVAVIAGQLVYASLDGTYVVDDDGVDFFDITARTMLTTLAVSGGPADQRLAIDGSLLAQSDDASIHTTGDVSGTTLSNLGDPSGLVEGNLYNIAGPGIANRFTGGRIQPLALGDFTAPEGTTFIFNGDDGGTLSQEAVETATGGQYFIAAPTDALITPDPVGALGALPTIVELVLVPVTGGDFLTEYEVEVLDLVVAQTIDLEAA